MEQSLVKALDHHSAPLFPPLPRRPLESDAYFTLVRILSHCSKLPRRPVKSAVEVPKQGENELEIHTEPAVCNEQRGTGSSEAVATTGRVSEDRMELDGAHNLNSLTKECPMENNTGKVSLEDKDPDCDLATPLISQNDQSSVQDICMEESRNVGCVIEGKGLSNSEDVDFSFDDLCVEMDNAGGSLSCGRVETEEAKQEMQPMELEKSLTLADEMCSPLNVNADEDLEEGEIMGIFGVDNESIDVFNEDTALLGNKKVDQGLNSEAILGGANQEVRRGSETFCKAADEGKNISSESILSMIESKYGNSGETKIHHMNGSILNVGEKRKLSQVNATNQGTPSTEKDISLKKKRGPLTEQRKEKRRRKKKMKQAEKNREQGVKRLKIEPIVKPKKVTVCRHYLLGRCHEDNCKFSHDGTPLTKAKPCCHFARKSCMKGEDCPYDHQLSKYPCSNYATKGFCGRGTSCMFSHEMTSPVGSSTQTAANVPEPQPNSSSAKDVNSDKQSDILNRPRPKIGPTSGKNSTERSSVVEAILKAPPREKPKGIGKPLFGESLFGGSLGNITQPGSSSRKVAGTATKVDPPVIHQNSDTAKTQNPKEALKQNKGINFLSLFGKASAGSDSCSTKVPLASTALDNKQTAASIEKCDSPGTPGQVGPRQFGPSQVGTRQFGPGQFGLGQVGTRQFSPGQVGPGQAGFGQAGPAINNQDGRQQPVGLQRGIRFLSSGKTPVQEASSKKLTQLLPTSTVNSDVLPSPQNHISSINRHSSPASESLKALFSGTPSKVQKEFATPNTALKANVSNMPMSTQKSLLSTWGYAAKLESKIKMDQLGGLNKGSSSSSSSQSTLRPRTVMDFL